MAMAVHKVLSFDVIDFSVQVEVCVASITRRIRAELAILLPLIQRKLVISCILWCDMDIRFGRQRMSDAAAFHVALPVRA